MSIRQCFDCEKLLPSTEFRTSRQNLCRLCAKKRSAAWRKAHPEQYKEYFRKYRANNRDKVNANVRNHHKRIREEALLGYGGKCACCGEADIRFLTIDHMNGGGNEHRKTLRNGKYGGQTIYRFLINGGFPKGYQALCYNCNCGKQYNGGTCPHKL